jgi:glycosyltransferase involved in cell wall biosynthesis
MRILFLSRWYPYPPDNGSKLRIYNLLRGLAQHHEVTLLSFADRTGVDPHAEEVRALCREVQVVPWKSFEPGSWSALRGFLSLTPRSAVDTFSPQMRQHIDRALAFQNHDLIIASQWPMADYARYFRGLAALFEEAELGVLYEEFAVASSLWGRFRHGLTWIKHRAYLARTLSHFKACTVVSEQERVLLSGVAPNYATVDVIPNCISLADYGDVPKIPQPNSLIFTGSFRYFANHDAMTWFLEQVYPHIQAESPEVHLTITGDHADLPLPPADHVTLTGFVDDVRPLIASASVSVVPIRVGGGTRLKILEAMALGTPVVTTSKGAEGLDVKHGQHLLVADTPEAFAEAIICLLNDPSFSRRLTSEAYLLVRERYDWAAVMPHFLNLVEQAALR